MTTAAYTRIKAPSLSERIRDALLAMLADGALRPGERLNEVHLAEHLGTSRSPVREALRELEGLGVVSSRPRHGFYATELTDHEIIELYEVSPWIHEALIRDFMHYTTPEICAEIARGIDTIDMANVQVFSTSLLAFRQSFLAHAHNRYLADQALGLYRRFFIVAFLVQAEDIETRMERIVATLRMLWQALEQRDVAAARAIVQADCDYWLKDVAPRFTRAKAPNT